jgi:NRPS condensation-like uncharacterized protein
MAKEKFETITLRIPKAQYEWLTEYCKAKGYTIQEVFSLRLMEFKAKIEIEERELQKKRIEEQVLTALERVASEKGLSVSELITVMAKG